MTYLVTCHHVMITTARASESMAQVETELKGAGLSEDAISGIMAAMQVRSLPDLASLLGENNTAVQQLQRVFELAAGYGYDDWLVFDASIVRGLAYYTGRGQQPPHYLLQLCYSMHAAWSMLRTSSCCCTCSTGCVCTFSSCS